MTALFETQNEPFGQIFTSSSWADIELAQRLMLDMLDEIDRFYPDTWYSRLGSEKDVDVFKPKWMEQDSQRHEFTATLTSSTTLTVTSNLFGVTPTRANLLKICRPYAVLYHVTAAGVEHRAQVSAVDGTNPILTVAAINAGSMPSDGASQVWRVISEPGTESEAVSNPRFFNRNTRFTTSEIFWDVFQIEKSRRIMAMKIIGDEFEHQVKILMAGLRKNAASAMLLQEPVLSNGIQQTLEDTSRPQLSGFLWWLFKLFGVGGDYENADIAKDMSGNAITDIEDIDNLAYALLDNGCNLEQDGWEFWCNPWTYKYLADFNISERIKEEKSTTAGYAIRELQLKARNKPVPIFKDNNWPRHHAALYHFPSVKKGKIKGYDLQKGQLPSDNILYERWQIAMQIYGCVIREAPVVGGYFWNLKQS